MPLPIARMTDHDLVKLDEVLRKRSQIEDIKIRKESLLSLKQEMFEEEKEELDRLE